MTWVDIIILIILVIPTVIGLKMGLIKTIIPLAGIMLGIFLAGTFYGSVGDWLSSWLESPSQANIAGFFLIFAGVMLVALIVAALVRKVLSLLLLGWVDRVGGAVFGLAIGGFVAGALLALLMKFQISGVEGAVQDSAFAGFFLNSFPFVLGLLPEEFDAVRDFFI